MYLPSKEKENVIYFIMADLVAKGYIPFYTICITANFNIIAYKNPKLYKLQTLISNDGKIQNKNIISDNANFDYFATFLPSIEKIIYVPVKLNNQYIYFVSEPNIDEYYWYEDFLEIKDEIPQKRKGDGLLEKKQIIRPNSRRVERPNPAILRNQINTLGYTGTGRLYGVSDNAIRKWENKSEE